MPKFAVPVTIDTTMTATIEVEADSVEEAVEAALAQARETPPAYEHDEGNPARPYFAGDGDYEAVEEIA